MKLGFRLWLLIIVFCFSLISIFGIPPAFLDQGVVVSSINSNSSLFEQGLRQGQIITEVQGEKISSVADFTKVMSENFPSNEEITLSIVIEDGTEYIAFIKDNPKIIVSEISPTNIQTGLDLAGGARALVKAENASLTKEEVDDLVSTTSNRLNEFGLTDLKVSTVSDLSGNNYMSIEIAGATPNDLEKMISEQGKFEAKIGNETVFVGGTENGIASVARSGSGSGITACNPSSTGGYYCTFQFEVFLKDSAAKRHAELTNKLEVNKTSQGNYLSQPLDLCLDNNLVDSLLISESLKGRATTQIVISGSGSGDTRDDAINDANKEMKQLQTVLITGSLPYKLEIVKLDTISPSLGKSFTNSILLAGIAALLAVSIVIFFRYRKIKSSLALIITSISEVTIVLGIASFISWNLDLPSIAGIVASIGTGIDSQIIVLDESENKEASLSLKEKLKRAFAIIIGAYFTSVVSVIPLYWAVAGFFKGFAITTIIGISVGVLITRPAFAEMIKLIGE
jgi:preprotein translocase subunit SecD